MSPQVEILHTKRGIESTWLAIDLFNQDVLDEALLDEKLREAANVNQGESGAVKFIVVDGKLVAFNKRQEHAKAYEDFERTFGIVGKPECAGMIEFNFTKDKSLGPRRKISDFSTSLAYLASPSNKLPISDSEYYKETVLREKLGEYFVIE